VQARIDLQQLRQLMADDRAYGQDLSDGLFGADAVRSAFAAARAAAQSQEQSLRLRCSSARAPPSCTACAGKRCVTRSATRRC